MQPSHFGRDAHGYALQGVSKSSSVSVTERNAEFGIERANVWEGGGENKNKSQNSKGVYTVHRSVSNYQ